MRRGISILTAAGLAMTLAACGGGSSDVSTSGAAEETTTEKKSDLQLVAAIALALYRAQTETQLAAPESSAVEVNAWRQFGLQRRLTQSSTIRRTK